MRLVRTGIVLVPLLMAGAIAAARSTQPAQPPGGQAAQWQMGQMGGSMGPMWQRGRGWGGPGPMPRHHVAMMWGIPAPYTSMTNPLPRTQATIEKGAAVYAQNCSTCHGKEGLGDGEAGGYLTPPPGNLAWLSDMPMAKWDPFMFWTVAEGGGQFGTAMPAFKDSLSKDDIWAVISYIQAHLPQPAEPKK